MEQTTATFVDGMGAAAATSGVLSQLQGRIFALLYLHAGPLALEDIAAELEQSKSNISVNIRGLVEWHLLRRTRLGGSRKDHYEAATDFWRVMQEIIERRFRWNVRQVLAAAAEAERGLGRDARERQQFVAGRLAALGLVVVPSGPIEVAIAATVLALAVELARPRAATGFVHRRPWLMAATFGLLHGLGFAAALREAGLPEGEVPLALFSFNVGIELGQIAFVLAVLVLRRAIRGVAPEVPGWLRQLPVYGMGALAGYWWLDRLLALIR